MSTNGRCWMSNVEEARLRHGRHGPEYHAALDRPSTCLLPRWHAGPHEFTFDGDLIFYFAHTPDCPRCGANMACSDPACPLQEDPKAP